jgi:hypothetical protein
MTTTPSPTDVVVPRARAITAAAAAADATSSPTTRRRTNRLGAAGTTLMP